MAGKSKKYFGKAGTNRFAILQREQALIRKNFDFIETRVQDQKLFCYGSFQPTDYSVNYKYRIKYDGSNRPRVTVINPAIEYHDDIHMYPDDNSLCLYHKTDLVWNAHKHHIYELIIPWTHEWFVFYELYLISGKWEHPFVAHTNRKDKK